MQANEVKDAPAEENRQAGAKKSKKRKSAIQNYFDRVDAKYKHYSHGKYILIGVVAFCVIVFLVEIVILGFP